MWSTNSSRPVKTYLYILQRHVRVEPFFITKNVSARGPELHSVVHPGTQSFSEFNVCKCVHLYCVQQPSLVQAVLSAVIFQ